MCESILHSNALFFSTLKLEKVYNRFLTEVLNDATNLTNENHRQIWSRILKEENFEMVNNDKYHKKNK